MYRTLKHNHIGIERKKLERLYGCGSPHNTLYDFWLNENSNKIKIIYVYLLP